MTLTTRSGRGLTVGVDSEVGPLREVIVHRPGTELDRLTPQQRRRPAVRRRDVGRAGARRARRVRRGAARARRPGAPLRRPARRGAGHARGARVRARAGLHSRAVRPGPAPGSCGALLDDTEPAELSPSSSSAAITKSDLSPLSGAQPDLAEPRHRRLRAGPAAQHAVPARQRGLDRRAASRSTRWPSRPGAASRSTPGPCTAPPAVPAGRLPDLLRRRRPATTPRRRWRAATSTSWRRGVVLIGMGERTTPMGVEMLARQLFATGQARRVLAVEMPKARSAMHLDTLLTMIDVAHVRGLPVLRPRTRCGCGVLAPGDARDDLDVEQSTGSAGRARRGPRRRRASGCCRPTRTAGPPSASSGTTPTTTWPSPPASCSATTATS